MHHAGARHRHSRRDRSITRNTWHVHSPAKLISLQLRSLLHPLRTPTSSAPPVAGSSEPHPPEAPERGGTAGPSAPAAQCPPRPPAADRRRAPPACVCHAQKVMIEERHGIQETLLSMHMVDREWMPQTTRCAVGSMQLAAGAWLCMNIIGHSSFSDSPVQCDHERALAAACAPAHAHLLLPAHAEAAVAKVGQQSKHFVEQDSRGTTGPCSSSRKQVTSASLVGQGQGKNH